MSEKRKKHEIKIIVVLSALILAIYGVAAGMMMTTYRAEQEASANHLAFGEVLTAVAVMSPEEQYALEYRNNNWVNPEVDVALSQTAVNDIVANLKDLEPSRDLGDAAQNLAQFGLARPSMMFMAASGSQTKTYYVGNYNATLDQYYVQMEGEARAYLVSGSQIRKMSKDFLDLITEPQLFAIMAEDITAMKVVRGDEPADMYDAYRSGDIFKVTVGGKTYDSTSYGPTDIFYALKNLKYNGACAAYDASESDLKQYGLADPQIYTEIKTASQTYEVKAGQGRDDNFYITVGDPSIVYQITAEEYQTVLDETALSNYI